MSFYPTRKEPEPETVTITVPRKWAEWRSARGVCDGDPPSLAETDAVDVACLKALEETR